MEHATFSLFLFFSLFFAGGEGVGWEKGGAEDMIE